MVESKSMYDDGESIEVEDDDDVAESKSMYDDGERIEVEDDDGVVESKSMYDDGGGKSKSVKSDPLRDVPRLCGRRDGALS